MAALFCLAGCMPLIGQGQPRLSQDEQVTLSANSSIGQTFTARQAGLSGLEIYVVSFSQTSPVEISLHLRDSAQSSIDITSSNVELTRVDHAGYYRLSFPTQSDSYLKDYYVKLDLAGTGSLALGISGSGSYLDGSLYVNDAPVERQLTFQQVYVSTFLAGGTALQALQWLWQLLLAGLAFILPGWALLSAAWSGWRDLEIGEKIGLAAGVGLALSPVVLLWMNLVGLHLGLLLAWIPIVSGGVFLLWSHRHDFHAPVHVSFKIAWRKVNWSSISFFFTLLCVVGIRLWVVRGIDFPLWGDSYQHTMIAQLILDQKGLFQSWSPYVPYTSLTVQYGFPAVAAVYSWVSGMPAPQSVLFMGQVINTLAVLTIYPLMMRISGKNQWAGAASVLIAGLLISSPMEYVNWGRYAQLAGQAILPAAIWLSWDALSQPRVNLVKLSLAGLVISGMLLTYYRMFFYFAAFFLAWAFFWFIPEHVIKNKNWKVVLANIGISVALILLLLIPWITNVSSSSLASGAESGLTSAPALQTVLADYSIWASLTDYIPAGILVLSAVGLLLSLARRRWAVAGIFLWTIFMASLVAGQIIHLPGAIMMQNFAVMIFLYLPASLLSAWAIGEAGSWLENRFAQPAAAVLFLVAAGFSIWGAYTFRNATDPAAYQLVTRPDLRAGAWIRVNTPQNATFLVEGYRINNGTSVVGSDGGWWLPLIANRQNSMPPQYALLNEKPQIPDYSRNVVNLVAGLEKNPPNTPAGLSAICQMGVNYVYIGQRQGMVGIGASQLFFRDQFLNRSSYREVYHQDSVSIFYVYPQACQAMVNAPNAKN